MDKKTLQITLPNFRLKHLCLVTAALAVSLTGLYWLKAVYPYYRVTQAKIYAPLREIKAESLGSLTEAMLNEGDYFQKGQTLFSLEAAMSASQLSQLDLKIQSAKQRLKEVNSKTEQIMEQYVYLKNQIDQSEVMDEILAEVQESQDKSTKVENEIAFLESEKSALQKNLDKLVASAPFEGVVLRRFSEPGEKIKEGDSVLLICHKDLSIEAEVPETMLSNISLNQTATITLAAYPGKTWSGQVSWISPSVIDGKLKIRVDAENLPFKTGLKADVLIKIR